jgi:hypothetical protein
MAKIGRNKPCPCGSGRKFKHCHGRVADEPMVRPDVRRALAAHAAEERIRQQQQGRGRPIVAAKIKDHQMVAVGNTVHFSKGWKTFPDFLGDYIKTKIGPDWGNAEIAKPLADRHPLMQWYDAYCRYQKSTIKTPGEVNSAEITGIVACYLGLAYALYLLDHNAELQDRLIKRLKDPGNFQGAYYELMVASILIRAGFKLTLEDETDPASKHCEFAAVSEKTGKRYWVEAKMRSVNGLLGRTAADGGADADGLGRLIPHLNGALAKPAKDERLIFIDLNAPPAFSKDGKPDWLDAAMRRLERYEEKELKEGLSAYVFVTNMAFHRELDKRPTMVAAPFGLGFLDFNRPGEIRITEAYRQKQKHIDAHLIGRSLENYLRFPVTFDGKLPSESLGQLSKRVVIGRTYCFEDVGGKDIVGVVTAAVMDEAKKEAVIAVTEPGSNTSQLLRAPMSDAEVAEYKEYGAAYFGDVKAEPTKPKDKFELFEWLMETQKAMPREKILDWFKASPNIAELAQMGDEELRMAYCEALVAAIDARGKGPQAAE